MTPRSDRFAWLAGLALLCAPACESRRDTQVLSVGTAAAPLEPVLRLDQTLQPADPLSIRAFGAELACDGDLLAVGAPRALDSEGSVLVYQRAAGAWEYRQALTPPQPEPSGSRFGRSLTLVEDRLVVATSRRVYWYQWAADQFVLQGELPGSSSIADPLVASRAERVVVGPADSVSAVAVHRFDGTDYALEQTIALTTSAERDAGFFHPTYAERRPYALTETQVIIGADGDDTAGYRAGKILAVDLVDGTERTILPRPIVLNGHLGYSLLVEGDRLFAANFRTLSGTAPASISVYELGRDGPAKVSELFVPGSIGADEVGVSMASRGPLLVAGMPGRGDEVGAIALWRDPGDGSGYAVLDEGAFAEGRYGEAAAFCGSQLLVGAPSVSVSGNAAVGTVSATTLDRTLGEPCLSPAECGSGFCVEGVCCDTDCTSSCFACSSNNKGGGIPGRCEPVLAGLDPFDDCTEDGSVCGVSGHCDGVGACAFGGLGTECGAGACLDDGTTQLPSQCDGVGSCVAGQIALCASGFSCVNGECPTRCVTDGDCRAGHFCDGTTCRAERDDGASCSRRAECGSGHCVDGTCCAERCDGSCGECSTGSCLPLELGEIGRPGCSPFVCDGEVTTCPSACASDRYCDEASFCAASRRCVARRAAGESCDPTVDCASADCEPCGGDASCVDGACCAPTAARGCSSLGTACDAADECASGRCVDGVCCDAPCDGQCEACDVGDSAGRCVPVTGAPRGTRSRCATGDPTEPCTDRACDGLERTACVGYVGDDVVCAPGSCESARRTLPATCDGEGRCGTAEQLSCAPFVCGEGDRCRETCNDDVDCSPGNRCDEGDCVSGSACRDASTEVDAEGLVRDCSPYQCRHGACLNECAATSDCLSGFVCRPDDWVCVSPPSGDGASCRVAFEKRSASWWWWLALAALGWRRRLTRGGTR